MASRRGPSADSGGDQREEGEATGRKNTRFATGTAKQDTAGTRRPAGRRHRAGDGDDDDRGVVEDSTEGADGEGKDGTAGDDRASEAAAGCGGSAAAARAATRRHRAGDGDGTRDGGDSDAAADGVDWLDEDKDGTGDDDRASEEAAGCGGSAAAARAAAGRHHRAGDGDGRRDGKGNDTAGTGAATGAAADGGDGRDED
jgi:hypothetical protein